MIKFYIMSKTYNCYGGHTTLSLISDFLLKDAPHFGDAIKEITLTFHFPNAGLPRKTLESLYEDHDNFRSNLPKIVYRRSSGKLVIDVSSELLDSSKWKASSRLSLPLFVSGVEEVITALSLIKKRIKKSDDFDLGSFLTHCKTARERIPSSEDELQLLSEELKAVAKAQRATMSPWQKLGIDWEDYHPNARNVLDNPFFWERSNDFAPNGNDTGADILSEYMNWIKLHKDGKPLVFIEQLARQWGYVDFVTMDEDLRDEAAIGLAFADLKLRAICDPDVRDLALTAIEQQRSRAQESTGWSHRDEKLKTLDILETKLKQTKPI